jgi:hypothetical protein
MINREKNMKKISSVLILFTAMLFLAGCSSVVSVSPSTTPITASDSYTKLGYASGRSSTFVILGLIPIGPSNPSKSARDSAIGYAKGANALTEVTEEYNTVNLLVFQLYWTTVEGTAIKFERKGADVE